MCLLNSGCAVIPEITHEPQVHNPFPQLHRVAILPFYNLSTDPTVNQDDVALAYYNELQQIPGFEVMPPTVVKQWLVANRIEVDGTTDFQLLARKLGVDAVIRGAVTEFTPYYPPRMGIAVDWFAANPSFYAIPPGYGLPWGTAQEEHIPDALVFEAEFALAREQLKTQTPDVPEDPPVNPQASAVVPAQHAAAEPLPQPAEATAGPTPAAPTIEVPGLPPDWPDPRGFIPPPPSAVRPPYRPQYEPVMTHTRVYCGDDEQLTGRLEDYFYYRDDARDGGWQGYLTRSQDFIRFCCYLHITETLSARGGAGKSRVVWRWPIGRYDVGTGRR
ncbi:MAG: hypothetical protein ACYC3X_09375 [Pirellulaceae bacterium]